MDLRSWRKVLIQWVSSRDPGIFAGLPDAIHLRDFPTQVIECRFTEHNFITLEQSDIDAFFSIYVQKAQVAPVEEENALPTQPGEHRSPLQNFLRDHYPEFSAHIDGRGQLVTADYVYV
ncbi:uncharacterized protein [Drosophila suzukii]|uniref:SnoaL-like domain-containing protein n=1 Tax=Drosophila suzukii TaxID=28584 RepID=A0ABM4TVS2_DROSZ